MVDSDKKNLNPKEQGKFSQKPDNFERSDKHSEKGRKKSVEELNILIPLDPEDLEQYGGRLLDEWSKEKNTTQKQREVLETIEKLSKSTILTAHFLVQIYIDKQEGKSLHEAIDNNLDHLELWADSDEKILDTIGPDGKLNKDFQDFLNSFFKFFHETLKPMTNKGKKGFVVPEKDEASWYDH